MMYQGVLGTFFFTVTDAEVATVRDLKQQREIQFAEHKCVSWRCSARRCRSCSA